MDRTTEFKQHMENSAGVTTGDVYSVSSLTRIIRQSLENNPYLSGIWVKGEISNLTMHSSGHIYFTLKDSDSVLSAVFFRNANRKLDFRLEEGMSVFALGGITVFEKRGSYQFNVIALRPEGIGELQRRIEELKKRLLAEGIFDTARKRSLPFLPRRVGIVTSPTGAALRDIIKVALRRYPKAGIIVAPATVQGEGAVESIVKAIRELNREEHDVDVIIAGRGGGSFEDLIAFNDEKVVRAFYNSRVPIVSAVGHQIDHPLSDDAADRAAPTPSAAAEMVFPVVSDLRNETEYNTLRMLNSLHGRIREYTLIIEGIEKLRVFRDPDMIADMKTMYLADIENRMTGSLRSVIAAGSKKYYSMPDISMLMRRVLKEKSHSLAVASQALDGLSPLAILGRGYGIIRRDDHNLVKSVSAVSPGDQVNVELRDGILHCSVLNITNEVKRGRAES